MPLVQNELILKDWLPCYVTKVRVGMAITEEHSVLGIFAQPGFILLQVPVVWLLGP